MESLKLRIALLSTNVFLRKGWGLWHLQKGIILPGRARLFRELCQRPPFQPADRIGGTTEGYFTTIMSYCFFAETCVCRNHKCEFWNDRCRRRPTRSHQPETTARHYAMPPHSVVPSLPLGQGIKPKPPCTHKPAEEGGPERDQPTGGRVRKTYGTA